MKKGTIYLFALLIGVAFFGCSRTIKGEVFVKRIDGSALKLSLVYIQVIPIEDYEWLKGKMLKFEENLKTISDLKNGKEAEADAAESEISALEENILTTQTNLLNVSTMENDARSNLKILSEYPQDARVNELIRENRNNLTKSSKFKSDYQIEISKWASRVYAQKTKLISIKKDIQELNDQEKKAEEELLEHYRGVATLSYYVSVRSDSDGAFSAKIPYGDRGLYALSERYISGRLVVSRWLIQPIETKLALTSETALITDFEHIGSLP